MTKSIGIATALAFAFSLPAYSQEQSVITLAQSTPFIAPSAAVQKLSESINLVKGQEKLQLQLTYYNGSDKNPGFKWLRISSPSMNYITEAAFAGKKVYSTDVTGDLSWSGNQLLITADGVKGAEFGWRLTTTKPVITGVSPQLVSPGSTVTITGTNLSSDLSSNSVLINGKAAPCISAASDKLIVQVPEDLGSGSHSVRVTTAGLDAGTLSFSANAVPYLKSLSAAWVPVGYPLTIYGDGFSADSQKITVFIGPVQVPISSSTPNSITVTIPRDFLSNWGFYQPVKVTVNGIKARNQLTVSASQIGAG